MVGSPISALLRVGGDRPARAVGVQTVVRTRIHEHAVVRDRLGHRLDRRDRSVRRTDDDRNRQPVLPGKLEVPLIVRRYAHDGAGPVLDQDEVRDPDRNLLPGKRVDRSPARIETFLLDVPGHAGGTILRLKAPQVVLEGAGSALTRRGFLRPLLNERMLRRQQEKCSRRRSCRCAW